MNSISLKNLLQKTQSQNSWESTIENWIMIYKVSTMPKNFLFILIKCITEIPIWAVLLKKGKLTFSFIFGVLDFLSLVYAIMSAKLFQREKTIEYMTMTFDLDVVVIWYPSNKL